MWITTHHYSVSCLTPTRHSEVCACVIRQGGAGGVMWGGDGPCDEVVRETGAECLCLFASHYSLQPPARVCLWPELIEQRLQGSSEGGTLRRRVFALRDSCSVMDFFLIGCLGKISSVFKERTIWIGCHMLFEWQPRSYGPSAIMGTNYKKMINWTLGARRWGDHFHRLSRLGCWTKKYFIEQICGDNINLEID